MSLERRENVMSFKERKKPDSTAREKIRELAESREKKAKNKKQSVKGKTKMYENFYARKKCC
jgi:hypothetical protein